MRLFMFLAMALALVFATPLPAGADQPTRPKNTKLTKRTIDASSVIDLCDLADARECLVWNQTDVAIMVVYSEVDDDCSDTPIDTGADTNVTRLPAGASMRVTLGQRPNAKDHTLCGKATGAVGSGNVYTVEVAP